MRKKGIFFLLAAMLILFTACASPEELEKDEIHAVGEKISTAFFDYTVTGTTSGRNFEGRRAESGCVFVTVELSIKNTEHYTMPMGRYDFQLQWGGGADEYCYPLEQYCQAQLPDEYDIPEGESVEGVLVFQVPRSQTDLALGFLEIFENDEQGKAFYTYFTI